MEEDWGALPSSRPTFSLFRKANPADEAKKDSFVDIVVYNRWSRSERRLYQKLKAEHIARKIEKEDCKSMDDITSCLENLSVFRNEQDQEDSEFTQLISLLQDLKLKKMAEEPIESGQNRLYQIKN